MKNLTVQAAFDEFMLFKTASGLSQNSLDAYRWQCLPLLRCYGDLELESLTQDMVYQFLLDILSRPITQSTKSSYIRSARIFLRWCSCEYPVNYKYSKIKVPKMPKKEVKLYSESDIWLIFQTIHAVPEWVGLRNKALFALLLDSGIRRAEACSLRRQDVDFTQHTIIVTGKGNKQRVAPFGNFTCRLIQDYLNVCPHESEYLFVDLHGGMLSLNAVSQVFHDLQDKLPFKLSPHKLRHNFATNYCLDLYDAGEAVDPLLLKALMGHEDMVTTQRYLHQASELIAAKNCISHLDKITAG